MVGTSLSLPNYFNGMELGRDDFVAERNYFDEARVRANRDLHTWGIASGLAVSMTGGERLAVTVGSGLAIDPNGGEIVLSAPLTVSVPSLGSLDANLFIRSDVAPTALSREAGTLGYKRIEHCPVAFFRSASAGVEPDAVFLARVTLNADGRIQRVDQESRRYCGFNLASLQLIDAQTGRAGATVAAREDGGLGILADRVRFAGSVAMAGGLAVGALEPQAQLDLEGANAMLLSVRNLNGGRLLAVDQAGHAGIGMEPGSGSVRLSVRGGVALDGDRAIRFDGGGLVGVGTDCCVLFDAAGPDGKPIALCASGTVAVLPGKSGIAALTVRGVAPRSDDHAPFDVWIGSDPTLPDPATVGTASALLTVVGPVQSLSGGFQFGSDAVQHTAAVSGAAIEIGAVVDWWPGPTGKELTLPAEFVVCDGQTINDQDSPYNGKRAPNLVNHHVRGTTNHDRIGVVGGAETHTHTVGTLPAHSHAVPHDHASAATLTQSDAAPGQASGIGEQVGAAVGHHHAIDLGLSKWEGETAQNTASSASFVTGPADNTPRSARLVKIIRIK